MNDKEELLMIYRKGYWDLPKGKQDKKESLHECALREVTEETGVTKLQLNELLQITLHTYWDKQQPILKETHWYKMQVEGPQILTPQAEEDITEVQWVPLGDLEEFLDVSFRSIRDVTDRLLNQS